MVYETIIIKLVDSLLWSGPQGYIPEYIINPYEIKLEIFMVELEQALMYYSLNLQPSDIVVVEEEEEEEEEDDGNELLDYNEVSINIGRGSYY